MATLPFTRPDAAGRNVTVRTAAWPGPSIMPEVRPLPLNPAPVKVTLEIDIFEFPLLVSVVVSKPLPPTVTLPNGKLAGIALSSEVDAVPVPLTGSPIGEFGAVLTSETDPFTAPADMGANTMLNDVVPPAAIVTGTASPAVLIPAPAALASVIVTLAVPPFFNVIICELLLPVITLPKFVLAGLAVSCA